MCIFVFDFLTCIFFIFFFFFQAEDGIRDPLVTGVQTCALPISGSILRHAARFGHLGKSGRDSAVGWSVGGWHSGAPRGNQVRGAWLFLAVRSEERRVGKECRSGWWPDT